MISVYVSGIIRQIAPAPKIIRKIQFNFVLKNPSAAALKAIMPMMAVTVMIIIDENGFQGT